MAKHVCLSTDIIVQVIDSETGYTFRHFLKILVAFLVMFSHFVVRDGKVGLKSF